LLHEILASFWGLLRSQSAGLKGVQWAVLEIDVAGDVGMLGITWSVFLLASFVLTHCAIARLY